MQAANHSMVLMLRWPDMYVAMAAVRAGSLLYQENKLYHFKTDYCLLFQVAKLVSE